MEWQANYYMTGQRLEIRILFRERVLYLFRAKEPYWKRPVSMIWSDDQSTTRKGSVVECVFFSAKEPCISSAKESLLKEPRARVMCHHLKQSKNNKIHEHKKSHVPPTYFLHTHTRKHTHYTRVWFNSVFVYVIFWRPWYGGSRMNKVWKRKLGYCTDLQWLIYFGGLAGVCHDEAAFAAYLQNRKKMRPPDKMYVCIHICTHTRIYTRWHRYWCIDIHVYMCRWDLFHVYVRVPVCMYVRILVHIYRCWSIDIGVYIYRWALLHTMNTHTVYVSRHLYS